MPARLTGTTQLRRRLAALKTAFQPAGRRWAQDTVRLAAPHIPVRSGQTRASLRVRSVTDTRAVVAVRYVGRFLEGDTRSHTIRPRRGRVLRFQVGGQTIFAKKAVRRRRPGTPFLAPAAQLALSRSPIREELVLAWNAA